MVGYGGVHDVFRQVWRWAYQWWIMNDEWWCSEPRAVESTSFKLSSLNAYTLFKASTFEGKAGKTRCLQARVRNHGLYTHIPTHTHTPTSCAPRNSTGAPLLDWLSVLGEMTALARFSESNLLFWGDPTCVVAGLITPAWSLFLSSIVVTGSSADYSYWHFLSNSEVARFTPWTRFLNTLLCSLLLAPTSCSMLTVYPSKKMWKNTISRQSYQKMLSANYFPGKETAMLAWSVL